jgi:ADP-ribose pyrophosphatase YjhB (NUDIX family)
MEKTEHFGVYGLVFNTEKTKILLVKKSRGPYTNLFDLPGGTPEAGESQIQTLYREFLEEVGVKPVKISDWKDIDFKVSKSSTGEEINFHHKAVVCKCKIVDAASLRNITSEDVAGFEWIDINETGRMSNLVLEALK